MHLEIANFGTINFAKFLSTFMESYFPVLSEEDRQKQYIERVQKSLLDRAQSLAQPASGPKLNPPAWASWDEAKKERCDVH